MSTIALRFGRLHVFARQWLPGQGPVHTPGHGRRFLQLVPSWLGLLEFEVRPTLSSQMILRNHVVHASSCTCMRSSMIDRVPA